MKAADVKTKFMDRYNRCSSLIVKSLLFVDELTSLEYTRDQLSRSFFQDICHPSSSLNHLLARYVIHQSCLGSEQPHGSYILSHVTKILVFYLWSPYVIGRPYIFSCCGLFFLLSSFFSSPNLSRRRTDVCHTSTHGVALVRI